MNANDSDVSVSVSDCTATLSGALQLHSVAAHLDLFEPIAHAIEAAARDFTIDLSAVVFMNSSAVSALARLVLLARGRGISVRLVGNSNQHWQRSTLRTLGRLAPQSTVDWS
jgi:anti-anti-sigma factor